jgi:hypothetical protein
MRNCEPFSWLSAEWMLRFHRSTSRSAAEAKIG